MRKTQIKIIKKAEKYKFDTEYVDVLSNLNCKISDIVENIRKKKILLKR